jgi:hypothetical protein
VLRDEPVPEAAIRRAVNSPPGAQSGGGRLREGLVQARDVGDHAVKADDLENAERCMARDDQGFSYAEEFVGTNGIGTALESGQPAHVLGTSTTPSIWRISPAPRHRSATRYPARFSARWT